MAVSESFAAAVQRIDQMLARRLGTHHRPLSVSKHSTIRRQRFSDRRRIARTRHDERYAPVP